MGSSAAALLRPASSSFSSLVALSESPSSSLAASRLSRGFCGAVAAGNRRFSCSAAAQAARTEVPPPLPPRRGVSPRLLAAKRPVVHQVKSNFRAFASMASESAASNPGLQESQDEATKGYFLQQTMYRIKDPKASLDFYTRILGMSLLKRLDFPELKFSLYFVGFEDTASAPTDPSERLAWTFGKKATLELTHNWGTESDENFKGHHNGNSDPRGYGHIGITVDDTFNACARFEKLGVKFVKKPDEGKMKGIAFIQDPDGYWIEIFDCKNIASSTKTT